MAAPAAWIDLDLPERLARPGSTVTTVELPAGPAVRRRFRTTAPLPGFSGPRAEVEVLQYFVGVPGTGRTLLLGFSTPVLVLADALVELFDAIAGSLRWRA